MDTNEKRKAKQEIIRWRQIVYRMLLWIQNQNDGGPDPDTDFEADRETNIWRNIICHLIIWANQGGTAFRNGMLRSCGIEARDLEELGYKPASCPDIYDAIK